MLERVLRECTLFQVVRQFKSASIWWGGDFGGWRALGANQSRKRASHKTLAPWRIQQPTQPRLDLLGE
eukprot:2837922-Amphidinium_carterae.1